MNLNKLKGNTYYIDSPTNIGVYIFKNKNCLLVDTGINKSAAKKEDDILLKNNLHPKYIINTHSHFDHCGGNQYFTENYPGCEVYASHIERMFMQNPKLHEAILFSSNPIKILDVHRKSTLVNFDIEYGINKIGNEKFEIIPLKGHSFEQIGIITPEKVCFTGDSIFSSEILDKYSFPFLYDVEEELTTLQSIKNIDADYFVISHSKKILSKDEISLLAQKNIDNIKNYIEEFTVLLEQPLTREDIAENLSLLDNLTPDFREYHINFSSLSAFLTYMYDKGMIDYSIENGKLYYFLKK